MKNKRSFVLTSFLLGYLWTGTSQAAPALPLAASFDSGWRLWLDPQAKWQNDTLYLPDEVHLDNLPVNLSTGGWAKLGAKAGIAVTLPSTVEQHYWGKAPSGVAASGSPTDIVNAAGNYLGVSWWYRPFKAPPLKRGERLVFSFPGARLRSEVYVNGHLCGYDLIGETSFTADATAALKPGDDNQLAVRITNPGGRLDWMDFLTLHWGKYTLPSNKGFGGLDGGVKMTVHSAISVSDLFVFNHPNPKTVTFKAQITSSGPVYDGPVELAITRQGKPVWSGQVAVHIPRNGSMALAKDVTVPSALLWTSTALIFIRPRQNFPPFLIPRRMQFSVFAGSSQRELEPTPHSY